MQKLLLIFHTIIYLKPIQIRYQLWYRIRRIGRKLVGYKYPLLTLSEVYPVALKPWIQKYESFDHDKITFLNQSISFEGNDIDWNFNNFGRLWTYNLNYFDFLLQPEMQAEQGWRLINDFVTKINNNSTALEPYPIALRGINWIKFICRNYDPTVIGSEVKESHILTFSSSLYAQYQILLDNIEYHLLGNHLLEDAFSLLFGAFYFKDEKLYKKAIEIIRMELEEQILKDGAHFELSPMYHQIILDRLLDCINLVQNNQRFEEQESLLLLMNEKAGRMLEWINDMTFSSGQIPLLNDSAPGIAASTDQLNQYAIQLGVLESITIRQIRQNPCNLSQSGYRRFNGANYECIIDIGQVGPNYQPGHAHADTFNFVVNVNNQSYLIDPGISTYEANKIRIMERGTASHNTVTIDHQNSSGVWSSFRVANRAKVNIITEEKNLIIAEHDGYRSMSTTHQREWEFQENQIQVTDYLKGIHATGKAHFWIAPSLEPEINGNTIHIENTILTFENADKVDIIKVKIPFGYNNYEYTFKLEITFNDHLKTTLTIN